MANIGGIINKRLNKLNVKALIPYLGLIAVIVLFQVLTGGKLLTLRNSKVLLNEIFSIGLGSAGVIFLMSQKNWDLSLGAIVGFSSALAAFSARISLALIFPVCLLTGLIIGFINGFFHAKLNIAAFITTLAMSFVLRGINAVMLGGSIGIPFSLNKFDNIYLKLAVFVAVLVTSYIVFEYTKFGKYCRAVGSLPDAARQVGINVERTKLLSFVISGGVCGLIAFFSLMRTSTASIATGQGFEFNVLLALIIGGLPLAGGWIVKFRSVVIGSLIMAFISNGMTLWGIEGLTQQLIKGIIFIVVVVLSFERKEDTIIT